MIDVCVAGALGKMGSTVVKEAEENGFRIVGAVESEGSGSIGRTLADEGVIESDVNISPPSDIKEACEDADVYISFTTPEAEISNLPQAAETVTPLVVGTTGYDREQMRSIEEGIENNVAAVFAPNFALGVNLLYMLVHECDILPENYDFSITEVHHNEKKDAPSGTANRLAEIVSDIRGYSETVRGREGFSPRKKEELEILSVRAGGVPGIHDLIIAGPDEMIRIEHSSFSRKVFAQGALFAAEWVFGKEEPGIYSMSDVLS